MMAMSPMKRLSDMMEAECLAEYLEHRRLPVEANHLQGRRARLMWLEASPPLLLPFNSLSI